MPAVAIPPADAVAVLQDWLDNPETQRLLVETVSRAIGKAEQNILTDTAWRAPRRAELRENSFERWIAPFRTRISDQIADDVHETFPFISNSSAGHVALLVINQLSPDLREWHDRILFQQKRFAVRAIALKWTTGQIRDGLLLGMPDRVGIHWSIPIYLKESSPAVAQILLDDDGEILTDAGALRETIELLS